MTGNIQMDALSLGFGVQSTGIALMAAMDRIPRPDKIYFSDLHRESKEVYDYIGYITPILNKYGIEITTVEPGDLYETVINYKGLREIGLRSTMIPLWYADQTTGSARPLNRQCTTDYKIEAIASRVRLDLGKKRLLANSVRMWMGISSDEEYRIKQLYPNTFRVNHYPLIGKYADITYPGKPWPTLSRKMIKDIFNKNGIKVPPKSSCYFCPFHTIDYWYHIYQNFPDEWQSAVKLDRIIRDYNNKSGTFESGPFYLWKGLRPLESIDFDYEISKFKKQPDLFSGCDSGFCFA